VTVTDEPAEAARRGTALSEQPPNQGPGGERTERRSRRISFACTSWLRDSTGRAALLTALSIDAAALLRASRSASGSPSRCPCRRYFLFYRTQRAAFGHRSTTRLLVVGRGVHGRQILWRRPRARARCDASRTTVEATGGLVRVDPKKISRPSWRRLAAGGRFRRCVGQLGTSSAAPGLSVPRDRRGHRCPGPLRRPRLNKSWRLHPPRSARYSAPASNAVVLTPALAAPAGPTKVSLGFARRDT